MEKRNMDILQDVITKYIMQIAEEINLIIQEFKPSFTSIDNRSINLLYDIQNLSSSINIQTNSTNLHKLSVLAEHICLIGKEHNKFCITRVANISSEIIRGFNTYIYDENYINFFHNIKNKRSSKYTKLIQNISESMEQYILNITCKLKSEYINYIEEKIELIIYIDNRIKEITQQLSNSSTNTSVDNQEHIRQNTAESIEDANTLSTIKIDHIQVRSKVDSINTPNYNLQQEHTSHNIAGSIGEVYTLTSIKKNLTQTLTLTQAIENHGISKQLSQLSLNNLTSLDNNNYPQILSQLCTCQSIADQQMEDFKHNLPDIGICNC